MQQAGRINVTELVDQSRIGGFHIVLFSLCALSLVMDGFDVQAMGYVGPEIQTAFDMPRDQFGNLLAVANLGLMLGALLFTIIGDRIGRRPALIAGTLFYAVVSILTARADSAGELFLLRFIGGFGLGSVVPNATALIGEYSPKRLRVMLMMGITVGFTAGAAFGGFIAAWLVPQFGWQAVFYFGGIVPFVAGIAMLFWLPESLQFLVVRNRLDKVAQWIRRIDPARGAGETTEFAVSEQARQGVPVKYLLLEGRAPVTILYWLVNFTNILNLYFLAGFLPTILAGQGIDSSTAKMLTALMQVGGTLGTFGLAWAIARRGFTPILLAAFAVATVAIAVLGSAPVLSAVPLLALVLFVAGWCVVGGQPGLNALAATYYPTDMRSTGIGWGLGWGRTGGILGPMLGGQLLVLNWPTRSVFFVFAVPAAVSVIAMVLMHRMLRPPGSERAVGQTVARK
jgi:MFS transporter, AAHS family, 4-hydroxybenzoate transporter